MMTRTHWIICLLAILPPALSSAQQNFCVTASCRRMAQRMTEWMDSRVDPCKDFYQYACGKFLENSKIPKGMVRLNPLFDSLGDEIEARGKRLLEMAPTKISDFKTDEIVRNYYKRCMNESAIEEDGLSSVKKLMEDIGGWPVLKSDWTAKGNEWYVRDIKMNSAGIDPIFIINTHVYYDYFINKKRIIFVDQPMLGLKFYQLTPGFKDPKVKLYYKYMVDSAILMGATKDRALKDMKEALEFEIALAKIIDPIFNPVHLYNPRTIRQLESEWKCPMSFRDYINKMFISSEVPQIQLSENERVLVTYPTFVKSVVELLNATSPKTVANYQGWRVFKHVVGDLNQDARKLEQEFNFNFGGHNNTKPRWKKCVRDVGYNFPVHQATWHKFAKLIPAAASLYLRHYFPQELKNDAKNTIDDVREVLEKTFKNLDWMSDAAKQEALRKLGNMTENLGGPQEFYDHNMLDKLYKGFVIDESHFSNARKMEKFWRKFDLSSLRIPVDPNRWFEHPYVIMAGAFYSPFTNSPEFPAGFLQKKFFDSGDPGYKKFSRLGFLYGHEATHGYDTRFKDFDSERKIRNWWDNKTTENFSNKSRCFVDQYGKYNASQVGMMVNGVKTLQENVADNGGIKLAYYAYVKYVKEHGQDKHLPNIKLNQEQLFFVDYAQMRCAKFTDGNLKYVIQHTEYAPNRFRVNGPLSNFKKFSEVFQCSVGSDMNPRDKCEIW